VGKLEPMGLLFHLGGKILKTDLRGIKVNGRGVNHHQIAGLECIRQQRGNDVRQDLAA
jgi:hypothetical protein